MVPQVQAAQARHGVSLLRQRPGPRAQIPCIAGRDTPSAGNPLSLTLVGNGWRLPLRPGGFGRLGGIWPELGTCQYVSGNHGTIRRGPDGWEMADAGSTNGTYVNGQRLATGSAVILKNGDSVRIATLDFIVE